jgi:hypothetical protein
MPRIRPAGGSVAAGGTSLNTRGGDHAHPTISDVVALANHLERLLTLDRARSTRPVGVVRVPRQISGVDGRWWSDPVYLDAARRPLTLPSTGRLR